MSKTEWTTTPPTEDGYYWAEFAGPHYFIATGNFVGVVYVNYYEDTYTESAMIMAYSPDDNYPYDAKDFSRWLGPLDVPPLPEVGV